MTSYRIIRKTTAQPSLEFPAIGFHEKIHLNNEKKKDENLLAMIQSGRVFPHFPEPKFIQQTDKIRLGKKSQHQKNLLSEAQ